jgi:hypothetical protein
MRRALKIVLVLRVRGRLAVLAYFRWNADRIVAGQNFGGGMVRAVIQGVRPYGPSCAILPASPTSRERRAPKAKKPAPPRGAGQGMQLKKRGRHIFTAPFP